MAARARVFDAVVLAGGRAMRLGGADKTGLVVGQQSLLGSVVSAVTSAGAAQVVVVGPQRPDLLSQGPGGPPVTYAQEEPAGSGPVTALRRGLAEVDAADVILAAADLPFLRAADVSRLLAARAGPARPGVVLLDASGRPQWLVSCWSVAVLRAALDTYRGRSLHGLLGPLDPVLLPDETPAGVPPAWLDCDTDDDVRRARAWAARGRSEQEATR